MLNLNNLEELSLFEYSVKDVIDYEYEANEDGGFDVKVADGQIKECVKILAKLMEDLDDENVPPWDNKLYLLAMRLYDEAYYDMCYGDR